MSSSTNIISNLLNATGLSITDLAAKLTEFSGKRVHRQQLQRWRDAHTGMTMTSYTMLEDYLKSLRGKKKSKR